MSDLQCPATFLIALPDEGRGQVHRLVEQVRPRRVAAVYSGPMAQAVESAGLAASELGLTPVVVEALDETLAGDLEAMDESAAGDPAEVRFRDAVEDLADVHRGETVLLLVHGEALAWVRRISVNGPSSSARQVLLPRCVPAEVEVDADGWRLKSWPVGSDGTTDRWDGRPEPG